MIEIDSLKPNPGVTVKTEEYLKNEPWEIGDIYKIKPGMYSETTNTKVELEYKYLVLHDIYEITSEIVSEEMIVMDVRFSNGHDTYVVIDWLREMVVEKPSESQYSCPECSGDIDVLDNTILGRGLLVENCPPILPDVVSVIYTLIAVGKTVVRWIFSTQRVSHQQSASQERDNNSPIIECSECGWMDDGKVVS